MSAIRLLGSMLVLLAMAGMAAAQPAESPAELALRIDRLIQQLNDDRFEVREEATISLIKIGLSAEAKLSAAAKDGAPETPRRPAEAGTPTRSDHTSSGSGSRWSTRNCGRPEGSWSVVAWQSIPRFL
jgi:hypothetical protein